MAGWTDVSGNDFDWQAVSFVNEFITALNERASVAGLSVFDTTKSAGHDIQAASFWATMQQWCYDNCTSFVESKEISGGVYVTADFDGDATIPDWTLTNFKNYIADVLASGYNGFRRYTTHPDDGGTPVTGSSGIIQAGDIIGPWIFQDLQKAINALEWTQYAAAAENRVNRLRQGTGAAAVTEAAEFAQAGPEPDPSELWTDIYRN